MKEIKKYTLGIIIAKRELEFMVNGLEQKIIIKMGKPRKDKEIAGDYYCPFIILGIGEETTKAAFGVDSFQSIELALNMIGAIMTLYYQRIYPNTITWDNDSRLGFPLPEPPEDILKKERQWQEFMKK